MNSPGNWKITGLFCLLIGVIALIVYLTVQPPRQIAQSASRLGHASPTQQSDLIQTQISTPTPTAHRIVATSAVQSIPLPTKTPTIIIPTPPLLQTGESGIILGSVIDDASEPLHLAEVQLQKKSGAGLIVLSTATAQKGFFSFPDLQPAVYQLTARHDSCAITPDSIQIVELKHATEFVTITLPRLRYAIRGLAREKVSKKPVVGQTVVCVKEYRRSNHKNFRFPEDIAYLTQSDSAGRFDFPSVIPGTYLVTFDSIYSATSPYTISNSNANGGDYFGPPQGRVVTLVDRDVEDVLIETAAFPRITGTVRNEAGESIEGATISADLHDYRESDFTARTDAKGTYDYPVTVLNNDGVSVPLTLKAFHPKYGGANQSVEGFEAGTVKNRVDFVLKKGMGKLYGTVTIDSQPLKEENDVQFEFHDRYRHISLRLNANQPTYRITDIELGTEPMIWAKAENTTDLQYSIKLTTETPEKKMDIDLKTLGTFSISGVVTDKNGNPLEGVMVIAKRWNLIQNKTETDANGFYRLDELLEGGYDLYFADQGENHLEGGLYGVLAGSQDVNIAMDSNPWRISGRGLYTEGRPLANTFLDLHRAENPISAIFYPETKDDGSYSFVIYQPGVYILSDSAGGRIAVRQFTIEPDTPKEIQLDLVYSDDPPVIQVCGRYYEKETMPVERFTYFLVGNPSQRYYPALGQIGSNGNFILMAEPGEYLLHFYSPYLPPLEVPVVIDHEIQFKDKDCLMIYQPER